MRAICPSNLSKAVRSTLDAAMKKKPHNDAKHQRRYHERKNARFLFIAIIHTDVQEPRAKSREPRALRCLENKHVDLHAELLERDRHCRGNCHWR